MTGTTPQNVISYLRSQGESVMSASSTVSDTAASDAINKFTHAEHLRSTVHADARGSISNNTPATTYTWQANPVKAPINHDTTKNILELEAEFPVASQHRRMLQSLGSQFFYSNIIRLKDGKRLAYALARFSGAIESAFGITREVMFFYTPYYDLQIRTFTKCKEVLAQLSKASREATPDLIFFSSPDDRLTIKLEDWSGIEFTAIPLAKDLSDEPIEIVRLLRDHVYARDLFYETTPVSGDRFFGRKSILQELKDDVINQRVSGVFGLRKSGKTSILQQLSGLIESESILPVFIDLEVLPSPPEDPTSTFVSNIAQKIAARLRQAQIPSVHIDDVMANPRPESLHLALSRVLENLAISQTRLVLLLDEIEFLTPTDQIDVAEGSFSGVAQTLGVLRSLVQETSNFTFILSGLTNEILENGRLYGRPNPLFSWAKARYIGPLSRSEADELATAVGAQMGIELEPGALAALYDGSGGHAYLYRNLASAVVSELPVITYRRIMRQSDVLRKLIPWKRSIAGNLDEIFGHLERYYPTEAVLLEMLVESSDEFATIASTEDRAIHHLASLGLLREHNGKFEGSSILDLR
ncbi:ATP-binding protein [Tsukamurella tyrosinosolvens]|nr:ATP-binding protein [Tsukamurella tyrosinosolvens]